MRIAAVGQCPGSFHSKLILELRVLDIFAFLHFEFFESEDVRFGVHPFLMRLFLDPDLRMDFSKFFHVLTRVYILFFEICNPETLAYYPHYCTIMPISKSNFLNLVDLRVW